MASFKAKTGRDRLRMRGKKKLSFRSIQTWPEIGNSKKIAKKLKKLKNINTAFSQAKTGRERLRMREKKILILNHSYRTRKREFQKNSKKNKKRHCGFFSNQNRTGHAENERKKVFSFQSIPTQPGIGNSKKIAKKIQKIKKHHYGTFSSQNGTGEAENVRKKKFSFWSIPTRPGIGILEK